MLHGATGELEEQRNGTVHNSTDGGKVVQRDHGIHLEVGGAEQTLDHDQTSSLEDDTTDLEQETDELELDLTEGGNDHTNHNDGDVGQNLHVGRSHTHTPGSQQDSHGCGGLEHLDEGHTEVEVGHVTANQTQTEHHTDGDNRAEVNAAGHLDALAAIEDGGSAGQDLGHDGSEGQVPCCEDDGETCSMVRIAMSRPQNGGDLRKPRVSRRYLLNRITVELRVIQVLARYQRLSPLHWRKSRSRHVDRGVQSRAGLLLLSGGVDSRQRLPGSLAGGADLLAFAHCEDGSLIGEEALEFEGSRPRKASLTKCGGSHGEKSGRDKKGR